VLAAVRIEVASGFEDRILIRNLFAHRARDVLALLLPSLAFGAAEFFALLLPRPNALLRRGAVLLAG